MSSHQPLNAAILEPFQQNLARVLARLLDNISNKGVELGRLWPLNTLLVSKLYLSSRLYQTGLLQALGLWSRFIKTAINPKARA